MKAPILITGCARSGTSLVAGIINMCGAFGGNMVGPNSNNAKGMFENSEIRQHIIKPYLSKIEVDPRGQYPLPDIEEMMIPSNWRRKVEDVMKNQGIPGGSPWMYKDAKLCLHWRVWHDAFPDAKWIVVRRKTPDIIHSCMRTGFMSAFNNPENRAAVGAKDEYDSWMWWVHQHEARFREMIEAGVNVKQVWPERMVDRDYGQTQEMLDWVGLEWTDEIFHFIEPKLWKARQRVK